MIIFTFFKLRKALRQVKQNPSAFTGDQLKELLWGVFIVPIIIVGGALILSFIMGYTSLFGFHFLIFKVLFWFLLVIAFIGLVVIRYFIKIISRRTSSYADTVINTFKIDSNSNKNEEIKNSNQ